MANFYKTQLAGQGVKITRLMSIFTFKKFGKHKYQWISHKMNNWHPWQLPIWPIWPNFEVNGLDLQCSLAASSKTAPRIFIFSNVLGAEYLFYVKSIATYPPHIYMVYYFSLSVNMLLLRAVFSWTKS